MLVRQVWPAHGRLALPAEATAQLARVRAHLSDLHGRFRSRHTWEWRQDRLAGCLPLLIALIGANLLRRPAP